jgi:predicted AAA+ superfamily ATPase
MTLISRTLRIDQLLKKKSFFLFGPRSTGKSFLIKMQIKENVQVINLLESDYFLRLSAHPSELESMIKPKTKYVVIDEVQKIPILLDEVHRLIEEKNIHFLLTGSSARKLKRGQANLLAGRARRADLFPLTFHEINQFDIEKYLHYGGLPQVYLSDEPKEELKAYVKTYLYEEIQAEGLSRNIPQFSRFLQSAALSNGQILNFTKIGNDAEVAPSTIRDYYQILEDTLIGFLLPPYRKTLKRKAIGTAKFYFFDIGVVHTITQTKHLERHSNLYGMSFEHWIAMEIRAYLSYRRRDEILCYWRSTHNHEVDFIIGDEAAIEVKSTQKLVSDDFKGLQALQEENLVRKYIMVSQDRKKYSHDDIKCLHYTGFLNLLWNDELI